MDVATWLRQQGLDTYVQAFADHGVDTEVLTHLTAEDLREIGVVAIGHRRKLLDAIQALREAEAPAPATSAPTTRASLGERREVAVLFADLAGYTKLSGELDAEVVHGLLGRFFEDVDAVVAAHGGMVDKHIGDCVMALFGAPVARGDDALRALSAALAIRERVAAIEVAPGRPLAVHVGLACGQVVASDTGSTHHSSYTVTGESVNLAARLTERAAPGEILVSDAVRRALAGRLQATDAGLLDIDGFDRPLRIWRVRGLATAGTARVGRLIGRAAELRQLETLLEAGRTSGYGHAVHVRGEAGIGKTRLVGAFVDRARAAGFAAHQALVLDFGAGTGQDAIGTLLRGLLGLVPGADAGRSIETVAAAEAEGVVDAVHAAHLRALLGLPQPPELRALHDAMDHAARRRGARTAMAAVLRAACARQPRMLVVEDLHWADAATLDHLAALARLLGELPAFLVTTSRNEGDPLGPAWRAACAGVPLVTLDLAPLRSEAALELATTLGFADAEAAPALITRAAGNPLFLEQLVLHAGEETGAVPGSVRSLVQARIDRLTPLDKEAVQAASILGQRVSSAELGHLLGRQDDHVRTLAAAGLLRPLDDGWLFGHALIRDAVYESLLRPRRRALHRRAAAWFADRDPVLHARHLDHAEDEAAPAAYLDAALTQARAHRHGEALALAARGLELATVPEQRFALVCLTGDLHHDSGVMDAARAAYAQALMLAPDEAARCRAWIGLASVKRIVDDHDGAVHDLDRALEIATREALVTEAARIHGLRGNLYFPRGDYEACLRAHEESLVLARRAGSAELEAAAQGGLGDGEYARGRMRSALRRFEHCVMLCRRHGFARTEAANASMVGHCSLYALSQPEALAAAADAIAVAAPIGHLRAELNAGLAIMLARLELGDIAGVRAQGARVLDLAERLGARRFTGAGLQHVAKAAFLAGARDEAVARAEEGLALARETGLAFHGPAILAVLARATPDPRRRAEAGAECEELLARGCVAHNHFWARPELIAAALDAGEWAEARRHADAFDAFTRTEPLPWSDFFVERGRLLAAHGEGSRDETLNERLRVLRARGEALGFLAELPAIDAALAEW